MIVTGEHLKKMRTEKGITQKELAEAAEISQAHIAKIENDKVDPRLSTVNRLLSVLNAAEAPRTCGSVMKRSIIKASPATPVTGIISVMKESGVSQIPIMDDSGHVGSITESTLIHNIDRNLSEKSAKDIMGSPFPVISSEDPVEVAQSLLDFHPAVLVTEKGKISGIITKSDLL